jgi:hypothetical protein
MSLVTGSSRSRLFIGRPIVGGLVGIVGFVVRFGWRRRAGFLIMAFPVLNVNELGCKSEFGEGGRLLDVNQAVLDMVGMTFVVSMARV